MNWQNDGSKGIIGVNFKNTTLNMWVSESKIDFNGRILLDD